ncbi:ABC transporter ATP-binding protein [Pseudorhodoplanes sp.]|uniref:ABC transporter ATP-binding protein n=1 Tax=Pseudorhodoplanes sp. TaxID=1934341 RepID=UPI002CF63300|nr:ABC transporter ATP-binding protein [Pseudorhodoplanes sp.]HWV52945.1 ABC transporter ATP-binding protein [Pseudorhodoplanes sp.]
MLSRPGRASVTAPTAASVEAAVRLDGVTKRFGPSVALDQAWLKIGRGEFMTLLGPSGCGKTTLLNLVAGFLAPNEGEIFIDGSLVTDVPAFARQTGIVFQNYALFPHMTVASNVAYGLKARGVGKDEIGKRVADVLAMMKLTGYEARKPRELSGGQQQRVALARALVIEPKVLLLDEPFSALDKNLRGAMQVEVKEIQRRLGVTTIFVTHDQSEALSLSDRIAVMSAGRICQIDTPEALYRRPADRFVASFIGEGSLLSATLDRMEDDSATVSVGRRAVTVPSAPLAGQSPGARVDLFVRPEHLQVTTTGDAAFEGEVAASIYQGDHVDLYVDTPQAANGRLMMRLAARDAAGISGAGSKIAIAITGEDAVAFPPAGA